MNGKITGVYRIPVAKLDCGFIQKMFDIIQKIIVIALEAAPIPDRFAQLLYGQTCFMPGIGNKGLISLLGVTGIESDPNPVQYSPGLFYNFQFRLLCTLGKSRFFNEIYF